MAITQDNIKRMLAYSGIAHAGYILLGVLPGTAQAFSATLFYIAGTKEWTSTIIPRYSDACRR